MPEGNTYFDRASQIDREAADWFVKRDGGLSGEDAKAFEVWLNSDSRCRIALKRHEQTWSRFEPIEEFEESIKDEASDFSISFPSKSRWSRYRKWVFSLAAVFAVGLSVFLAVRHIEPEPQMEFEGRFVADAYQTRILADGTILELNRGARIKVRLSDTARYVWLHEGEVHFHVAKDAARPFVVHAGSAKIKAVGTAFNVRLDADQIQVVVTEGRVNLSKVAPPNTNFKNPVLSSQLDVGQISTLALKSLTDHPPFVETVSHDQFNRLLAWKPETLEFRSTPLGDVVTAFNKRNEIQIILADDELETMPIEATFRSNNILAFARLLELTFELEAERRGQNEIVIRKTH